MEPLLPKLPPEPPIPPAQKPEKKPALSSPAEKGATLLNLASSVGLSALIVFAAPVTLAALAISHLVCSKENSLWNKLISGALLPSLRRAPSTEFMKKFDSPPIPIKIVVEKDSSVRLDGYVVLAKGVSPEVAKNLPTVVLFNQNDGQIEDEAVIDDVKRFQDKGFNVVTFNYRGVGKSTGIPVSGADLIEDGTAVVDKLVKEGFSVGGITLKPKIENVMLVGSSIGGAVAAAVGKSGEYSKMMLVINRSFTNWIDAAVSVVDQATNPLFGKIAKRLLSTEGNRQLDNEQNLYERFAHMPKNHGYTLIETALQGEDRGDGILSDAVRLDKRFKVNDLFNHYEYEEFVDTGHNDYIAMERRNLFSKKLESLQERSGYSALMATQKDLADFKKACVFGRDPDTDVTKAKLTELLSHLASTPEGIKEIENLKAFLKDEDQSPALGEERDDLVKIVETFQKRLEEMD